MKSLKTTLFRGRLSTPHRNPIEEEGSSPLYLSLLNPDWINTESSSSLQRLSTDIVYLLRVPEDAYGNKSLGTSLSTSPALHRLGSTSSALEQFLLRLTDDELTRLERSDGIFLTNHIPEFRSLHLLEITSCALRVIRHELTLIPPTLLLLFFPKGKRPTSSDTVRLGELSLQIEKTLLRHHISQESTSKVDNITHFYEEKNRLLSYFSHDIRGPLSSIVASTQLLSHTETGAQEMSELHESNLFNCRRINSLIDSMLDFAHLHNGTLEPRNSLFCLNALINDTCRSFAPAARVKSLYLTFHPSQEKVTLYADRDQLQRCLENILSNALKATHEGGITFRLNTSDGVALLSVDDTGEGFNEDMLPLSPYRDQNKSLHGLGLEVTRALVALNQGTITYSSLKPRGTSVRLSFAHHQRLTLISNTHRVLLIDDDIEFSTTVRRLLSLRKFSVDYASTSEQALAQIRSQSYEAIISDYHLGHTDTAHQLLDDLIRYHAHIPVVFLSGVELNDSLVGVTSSLSKVKYLRKPVTIDELHRALAT
jgi:signal transduction histidine kinase